MVKVKICAACNESKPLEDYGLKFNSSGKRYREARCKPCRSARNARLNQLKQDKTEAVYEETVCPCDYCFSGKTCKVECVSFKCWERTGV